MENNEEVILSITIGFMKNKNSNVWINKRKSLMRWKMDLDLVKY